MLFLILILIIDFSKFRFEHFPFGDFQFSNPYLKEAYPDFKAELCSLSCLVFVFLTVPSS
jgi:hypothetical protein